MRGPFLRVAIYVVMGMLWSQMSWSAGSFVATALVVMFGSRWVAGEYPFEVKS